MSLKDIGRLAGIAPADTYADMDGVRGVARFDAPSRIASDSDGNLYVAAEHTIRKITPNAEVTTLAGRPGVIGNTTGPAASATFDSVRGIAFANGAVFISDRHNNAIKKVANGTVSVFAGSPSAAFGNTDGAEMSARFYDPEGMVADSAGNLYVADGSNHTIRKITPGGVVSTIAGSPKVTGSADGRGNSARFNRPLGVAVDGSGKPPSRSRVDDPDSFADDDELELQDIIARRGSMIWRCLYFCASNRVSL